MSSLGCICGWNPLVVSGFVKAIAGYQLLDIFEFIITTLNNDKLLVAGPIQDGGFRMSRGRNEQCIRLR